MNVIYYIFAKTAVQVLVILLQKSFARLSGGWTGWTQGLVFSEKLVAILSDCFIVKQSQFVRYAKYKKCGLTVVFLIVSTRTFKC